MALRRGARAALKLLQEPFIGEIVLSHEFLVNSHSFFVA